MPWRVKRFILTYIGQGMTRDRALSALQVSRHQYYNMPKSTRPSKMPAQATKQMLQGSLVEQADKEVGRQIEQVQ